MHIHVRTRTLQAAEWYRMTSLWAHDAKEPRSGYIWRTRNKLGDKRVQTDIIGGAYCITGKCVRSACRLLRIDRSLPRCRRRAERFDGLQV